MIKPKSVIIRFAILLSIFLTPAVATADASNCSVDPAWLSKPSLPTEVKKSGADGSSNFCDFYQFSTQTFLYLMSQSGKGDSRNFQVNANYPLLEFNSDGSPGNSCDDTIGGTTLRTSLAKTHNLSTGQAGGGATIYAQDGNVIYYDVRFNKALCNLTGSAVEMQKQNIVNFPAGTMELKFAWKKLSAAEIAGNRFVTQKHGNDILGLVGMHVIVATKDHPEFVWATYEHNTNTPDCIPAAVQTGTNWTFASAECTKGLPNSAAASDACKFNQPPKKKTDATGTPTNICRVNPFGTGSGDLKAGENLSDISDQNAGLQQLLNQSSTQPGMKVLLNYFNVGALWLSDVQLSSGGAGIPNERGSLRLANSVAESDYQNVDVTSTFASNCFGCHNYIGTGQQVNNNITSQSLSHTFVNIKTGQKLAIDVTAPSPISNNAEASAICDGKKGACVSTASFLKWNGQWTNINPQAGSVCGCVANQ